MNDKLIKDIELGFESLDKWLDICIYNAKDHGTEDCAFCREYLFGDELVIDCLGCPIRNLTGRFGCFGTPYGKASVAADNRAWGSSFNYWNIEAEYIFICDLVLGMINKYWDENET
jgi:hypothetical protein